MILGIIPARYASTRFPGKPLADIYGKTMIQRVYEQACQTMDLNRVVVATDDTRIYEHVCDFGGEALFTRSNHLSGTDRCAEVATHFPDADIIVNIQGDEPFIQPYQIDLLVDTLQAQPEARIATLAKRITDADHLTNPNVVKVVFTSEAGALYFSRLPIPFGRGQDINSQLETGHFYKHIGLYAFRRDALLQVSALPPASLELIESLEQLRWLSHGVRIAVAETPWETVGIDTPEDLERLPQLQY